MRRFVAVVWLTLGCAVRVVQADLLVGSSAEDGGALVVRMGRHTTARVSFSDTLGNFDLYTATEPGFEGLVRPFGAYPLRAGTPVWIEALDLDGGHVSLKVRHVLLTVPGARALLGRHRGRHALHRDPEYLLLVDRTQSAFSEGRFSFRLHAPGYLPSPAYTLRLSNGYLPPADLSPLRFDAAALDCYRTLARETPRFLAAVWQAAADGAVPDDPAITNARDATTATLLAVCGAAGSNDYDERRLRSYLDLIVQRTAALVGDAITPRQSSCGSAMAEQGSEYGVMRTRRLTACLLAVQRLHATEATAALPIPTTDPMQRARLLAQAARRQRVASIRADARCAGESQRPDTQTMLGIIEGRRRRAARAIRLGCNEDTLGTAGRRRFLNDVGCMADEIVSAGFATARNDLAERRARWSQGGRPLSTYFGCLVGGAE
ncbi:MAG TPA: hypothetical protein VMS22_08275 [Candidatus Eisenbacteria bacterium]|nr:hypothetical protein [Candidatus Eisenbacteria bacterium]